MDWSTALGFVIIFTSASAGIGSVVAMLYNLREYVTKRAEKNAQNTAIELKKITETTALDLKKYTDEKWNTNNQAIEEVKTKVLSWSDVDNSTILKKVELLDVNINHLQEQLSKLNIEKETKKPNVRGRRSKD